MSKQEIKKQIKSAIENSSYRSDVRKVSLFGSYLRNEQNENSDVDLLVEFNPDAQVGFFKFAQIQRSLSDSLGRKVDLLTPRSVSKFFRDDVLAEAEMAYEQR